MTDDERVDGPEVPVIFLAEERQRRGLEPSTTDRPDTDELDPVDDREQTLDVAESFARSDELWLGEDGSELDPDYVMQLYIAAQAAKAGQGDSETNPDGTALVGDGGELIDALRAGLPIEEPAGRAAIRGSAELAPQRRHSKKRQRPNSGLQAGESKPLGRTTRSRLRTTTVGSQSSNRRGPARGLTFGLLVGVVLLGAAAGVHFRLTSGHASRPVTYPAATAGSETAAADALWAKAPTGASALTWDAPYRVIRSETAFVRPKRTPAKRHIRKTRHDRSTSSSPNKSRSVSSPVQATAHHQVTAQGGVLTQHPAAATNDVPVPATSPTETPRTAPAVSSSTRTSSATHVSGATHKSRATHTSAATRTSSATHTSNATQTSQTTSCSGAGVLAPTNCGRPSL